MLASHLFLLRFRVAVLVLCAAGTLMMAETAFGSDPAALFLNVSNSPRTVGIGNAGINLVTPESPLCNPAGIGLFHLDHVVSFNVPSSTKWLPNIADDVRLKSWGVSAGASYRMFQPNDSLPVNVALGLAYSRLLMDFGTFVRVNENGQVIGASSPYDKIDCFSGGVAVEILRVARLGVGYSVKKLKSVLSNVGAGAEQGKGTSTGNAHDWGYLVQLRLHELVPHRLDLDPSGKYYAHLELTPSYAYVKSNVGDSLAYIDAAQKDAIPEGTHKGPAVYGAIDVCRARVLSVYWTTETWKTPNPDTLVKPHGIEFGLGDIFFYRTGKYILPNTQSIDSKGYGVSLGGIISWLEVMGAFEGGDPTVRDWASRVDVRFDFAKLKSDTSGLDGTKFYKLTFSLAL
jgi:hypothetical protein